MKLYSLVIVVLMITSPAVVHADSWGQPEVDQPATEDLPSAESTEIEPTTEPAPLSEQENRELAAEMKKLEKEQQAKSAEEVQKLVSVVFSAILKSANQNQSKSNLERRMQALQREAQALRRRELALQRELRRQQGLQKVRQKKKVDPIEQLFYSMVISSLDPKDRAAFRQKLGI